MQQENKFFNHKQIEVLKALCRTGVMTEEHMDKIFKITKKEINFLIEKNYIKTTKIYNKKFKLEKIYFLTQKGKNMLKNDLGMAYVYRTCIKQMEHDLKLSKFYCQLDRKIRNTWITETEILHKILPSLGFKSTENAAIDAIIKHNKQMVGIEAITKNYSIEEKQAKKTIAEKIGCKKLIIL